MDTTTTEAAPFESMSKLDQVAHLLDVHRVRFVGRNVLTRHTKTTKAQLEKYHARLHESIDGLADDVWQRADSENGYVQLDDRRSLSLPAVRHTHAAQTTATPSHGAESVDPEDAAAAARALINGELPDKPLSASVRRVVSQLIDNEFSSLEAQMREMAADTLQQKLRDNADARREKQSDIDNVKAQMEGVMRQANDAASVVAASAERLGISISTDVVFSVDRLRSYMTIKHKELDARDAAVRQEHKDVVDRAIMTIKRKRLEAQRRVLVAGLTPEAAELLNGIPSAQSMMLEAAHERSKTQVPELA